MHPCPECGTPTADDRKCCSRKCANKSRPRRVFNSTFKPCPCGSGLIGRRTTLPNATGFGVCCDRCRMSIPLPAKQAEKYGSHSDEQDRRNALARRRIEELRDARELGL